MSLVTEPFLINPPKRRGSGLRRRSKKSKRKFAKLINPMGGSLMIAGLNPKRRKHKKHRMHFGGLSLFGGHRRRNKHKKHHRRRHNPAISLGGFGRTVGLSKITGNLGNIVVGGISLIATPVLANMTGFASGPAWKKYGVQTAVVLGGSAVLGMLGPTKKYAGAFVIGGAAGIAAALLREFVIPMIPGMSAFKGYDDYTPGYPAFGPGYVPLDSLSGYEGMGADYQTIGAFPGPNYSGDGLGAFPDYGPGGASSTPFIPAEGTSVY